MSRSNPNSLLFLYEGETEGEFYTRIFSENIPKGIFKRTQKNLKGSKGISKKVQIAILSFLDEQNYADRMFVHVVVAYDRDGPSSKPGELNLEMLRREFVYPESRIISIEEIVATTELESWLFIDVNGILNFLGAPVRKLNLSRYNNHESFDSADLSKLFRVYKKRSYQKKRKKIVGFIDSLDTKKIFENCEELRDGVKLICKNCSEGDAQVDLSYEPDNTFFLNEGQFVDFDDFYRKLIGVETERNFVPVNYTKIVVYINPNLDVKNEDVEEFLTTKGLLSGTTEVELLSEQFIVPLQCKPTKSSLHLKLLDGVTDIEISFLNI